MVPISHGDGLAASFVEAARGAGTLALAFFRPGASTSAKISHKAGGSPVTEADYLVDRFLKQRLEILVPDAGWLSEETADTSTRLSKDVVLVVDPIDGTRSFMRGHGAWAIAIALVEQGRPLIGVVHAPALGEPDVAVWGAGARLNGKTIEVSKLSTVGATARVAAPVLLAERLREAGLQF
ncbi:MAG: inositol monophosphatase family protein, partial [Methylocella sp.]